MNCTLRNYCFTLNNYTENQYKLATELLPNISKYAIIGKEKGDEKETEHLQGYVQLQKITRFNAIKQWWINNIENAQPHIEKAKAKASANRVYCSKDGKFWEHGQIRGQGDRCDIEEFLQAVKRGATDIDLIEGHPKEFCKYYESAQRARRIYAVDAANKKLSDEMKDAILRPWQKITLEKLEKQNNRQVTWIYDKEGGMGKSWLADYISTKGPTIIYEGGKSSDIAHAYNYEPTVIFDFTREKQLTVNYSAIECFKNGRMSSPKYDSHIKRFPPCKVLVFSNFEPDTKKLSKDRWDILTFENQAREEINLNNLTENCNCNNCNTINCFCTCHINN